jgi:cytochrome c peroxidase
VIANGRLIGVQGRTSRPAVIAAIALLGAVATGAAGKDEQAGGVAVSITVTDEIARVVAEIDEIEAATLERLKQPPDNQVQQIELLGKL